MRSGSDVVDRLDPDSTGREPANVEISVVVPVYGCRDALVELHERVTRTLTGIVERYELILVDDGSEDGAWPTILDIGRTDPTMRGLRLSRNFGQHAAITAGLSVARGDRVVVMDCDLQEPPEAIALLHAKAIEGCDVVTSRRRSTEGPRGREIARRGYARLRGLFLDTKLPADQGSLTMLSRKAVESFLRLRDRDREFTIAVHWLGFRRGEVYFERATRPSGRSAYSLARLIRVSLDGFFFQTSRLLHWIVGLGLVVVACGGILAAYFVLSYLSDGSLPGYTSLAVLLLTLSGFIIISLGVVGLYVGRIFEQVKERPLFVVDAYLEDGDEVDTPRDRRLRQAGV